MMDLVLISHAEIDEKATLIAELNNQVGGRAHCCHSALRRGLAHPSASALGPGSPPCRMGTEHTPAAAALELGRRPHAAHLLQPQRSAVLARVCRSQG